MSDTSKFKIKITTDYEYPSDIVWACAAAAQRINQGYLKESRWTFSESADDIIEHPGNRSMMLRFLESYRNNILKKTEVTDEDYAAGKRAQEFWQSQMLLLLDDKANEYLRACTATAHKETVDALKDVGIIASSIQAADRELSRARLIELKTTIDSQYIHEVGARVEFDCDVDIIDVRYIDKIGAFAVESIIQDNLYSWWSRDRIEVGKYSFLKGRVKQLKTDYHTTQPVTHLNYVKVAK